MEQVLVSHKNYFVKLLFHKAAISIFLDSNTINILYISLNQRHFDYCRVIGLGRFIEDVHKLSVLQKRCARILLGVNSILSSTVMFLKLGWKELQDRCDYFKSLVMFKALNNLAPHIFVVSLVRVRKTQYTLLNSRQAAAGLLALPTCKWRGSGND